jgi:mRNA interferase HicA
MAAAAGRLRQAEWRRNAGNADVDIVTINGYYSGVKASELRRWLKKQGCSFVEESRHTRIILGSKVSRMPRHPAKEIKSGTLLSILKDLSLEM